MELGPDSGDCDKFNLENGLTLRIWRNFVQIIEIGLKFMGMYIY